MDANEALRVRQSASTTTSPDRLWELASDPSVTVRASLAMNPALPEQVAAVLASDTDARVRTILSRKLAALTPTLTNDARQRVQQTAVANLTAMVAEAGLRVRASIAQAVRDLPDGPRDIVLRLAYDPAVMVCEPIILFSPMLTQEDLVALITSAPPPSTMLAVAKRPRIGTSVSDALVNNADSEAILALLANPTAQIREATLDALAAQSEEHTAWQEPLVRRPHLPVRAQRMLAEIVTGHLLETLGSRPDLDPKVAQTLRIALQQLRPVPPADGFGQTSVGPNLGNQAPGSQAPGNEPSGPVTAETKAQKALEQAQALHQAGRLDDQAILDSLRRNAVLSATAMLAVKAGVGVGVIERACDLRSAKALVSLAWKAGLSAKTAVVLQAMLARLGPELILRPREDGGFPLSDDEMRWQLAFLGVGETKLRPWTPRRLS